MKSFTFEVSATFEIDADEIWVDGDGPEDPTLEDVLEEIQKCGGPAAVIQDWNLTEEMDLTVEGRPVL